MTSIEIMDDPQLFAPFFTRTDSWRAWRVVLKAIDGLSMDEDELLLFRILTGRQTPPTAPFNEAWFVFGRRGGKSFIVAFKGIHLACFVDYKPFLGPGERGVIMIIATDRKQSRVIMRYLTALLNAVPMLAALIVRQDTESIDLSNGISIEITTASYRTIRGYTVVAALCDEIAFWRSEDSANPAEEILSSLRPAMATIPGALLLGLSSPYKRSGPLYDNHRKHYGKEDSPILVVQADTRTMNPTVPQSVIDRAMELDPAAAQAEYLAQFRSDVGSFLDSDLIELAIETGRLERAPLNSLQYFAHTDSASGSGKDWWAVGIAHRDPKSNRIVLDVCRGIRPPFDPSRVAQEFSGLLKQYRCYTVVGDHYAGQWAVEAFSKNGITYKHSDLVKSEIYLEVLPLFSQGIVDLLDAPPLAIQLMQLERKTARSGRDSVDHAPGGHDDFANAACGALVQVAQEASRPRAWMQRLEGF